MEPLTSAQEEIFWMGVEMIEILEKTTPEKFKQYKAEFLEMVTDHPSIKDFVNAVFDIAGRKVVME